ncbi:hypothetical protein CL619_05135 [archaeon]|nr:hypothetical protein [archaeon]
MISTVTAPDDYTDYSEYDDLSTDYSDYSEDSLYLEDYDYYDFENYMGDAADTFYATSDPLEWDLDQVDFSNPEIWNNPNADQIFAREDSYMLYYNDDFYHNFDQAVEHYDDVDWSQFNFGSSAFSYDSIYWGGVEGETEFHDAIATNQNGALDKYKETYLPGQTLNIPDFSDSKNSMEFGEGTLSTTITSSRGTVTTNDYVNFDDHPGATFSVMDDGEVRVIYTGDNNIDSNSFDEDTEVKVFFVSGEGESNNVAFDDGNIPVEGDLLFTEGEWILDSGDSVTINGMHLNNDGTDYVKISGVGSTYNNRGVLHENIYSDLSYGDTVVHVGEDTFAVVRNCDRCDETGQTEPSLQVTVTPENTYGIPVEEKNDDLFYSQPYDDHLTVTVHDGSFVWSEEESNAEVYGEVGIENGHREVLVDGAVYSKAISYEKTSLGSVAFDVEIFDVEGNDPYADLDDASFTNTFSFGENQQITFGDDETDQKVAHFSVTIDPYEVFGDYEESGDKVIVDEAVTVINELDGTNFYRPYFIISTPEDNPEFIESYEIASDIIATNLPKGYQAMVIQLEADYSEELQSESNAQFLEIIDEQNDLEHIDSTILGHSSYFYNPPTHQSKGGRGVYVVSGLQIDASSGTEELTSSELDGLSTILGKDIYSGYDLSSGELQKLEEYNNKQVSSFETEIFLDAADVDINSRVDDALGCNEALEKYAELRLDVISEGIESGIITQGTREEFSNGEVDFFEELIGDSGLAYNGLNIQDEEAAATMEAMLSERIDEVDEYYYGLEIGSSTDLKQDEEVYGTGITTEALPYFAAMRVIEVQYVSELQELEREKGRSLTEPELLAFGVEKDIDFQCEKLGDSEYKEITC